MELNVQNNRLRDSAAGDLVSYISRHESSLDLSDSNVYYKFPILRDEKDSLSIAELLIVSRFHGIFLVSIFNGSGRRTSDLESIQENLDDTSALIYSRLLRNRELRKTRRDLKFEVYSCLYTPNWPAESVLDTDGIIRFSSPQEFASLASSKKEEMEYGLYNEIISSLEGAKGIIKPKLREISNYQNEIKGHLANKLEEEIYKLDKLQKHGAMTVLDGFQRVRGLAGSGKTVVLAMKAALTHLREPDKKIAYCFYTKSLYQNIKRLITRFYRQFDDKDPDWNNLRILHGWGGQHIEGMYSLICRRTGIPFVSYNDASTASSTPFAYACTQVLQFNQAPKLFDYIFIDEGQDFPKEFIELCLQVCNENRVVYAYDELQTIFQPSAPSIESIRNGREIVLSEDVVLQKCYRNPLEIIVCAHAIGLGIYSNIVQMLENRAQWADVGYNVVQGDFVTGTKTIIHRPRENSLAVISDDQTIDEIIIANKFETIDEETSHVCREIQADIANGLRADDILVICLDDRNAKKYLRLVETGLAKIGIASNNIHDTSTFSVKDFQRDEMVTLSTVHKAKGNEAYMVYIMGVDALFPRPTPKQRNMIFTGMTRAKGWVRMSGMGEKMATFIQELEKAKDTCPNLEFDFPDLSSIRTILRDLEDADIQKLEAEREIESLLKRVSLDDIRDILDRKNRRK